MNRFLICILLATGSCVADNASAPPDLASRINQFTLGCFRTAAGTENMVMAPASIHSVMSMALAGAQGETESDLLRGLQLEGLPQPHDRIAALQANLVRKADAGGLDLVLAQSVWPDATLPLRPAYRSLMEKSYRAPITPLPYQTDAAGARTRINRWVADTTRERIPDLLPEGSLDAMTRLVLVNAVYFKGAWATAFPPEATRPSPFRIAENHEIEVPTMHLTAPFRHASFNDLAALVLPYLGRTFELVILLPATNQAVNDIAANLTPERLTAIDAALSPAEVRVALPRFTSRVNRSVKGLLQDLGMGSAFIPGETDLSGIAGAPGDLFVSDVIHEAFIEVTEEGTEAAAATGAIIRATSLRPSPPVAFTVDRPFLYLLRDTTTGTILFIGQVVNPAAG